MSTGATVVVVLFIMYDFTCICLLFGVKINPYNCKNSLLCCVSDSKTFCKHG